MRNKGTAATVAKDLSQLKRVKAALKPKHSRTNPIMPNNTGMGMQNYHTQLTPDGLDKMAAQNIPQPTQAPPPDMAQAGIDPSAMGSPSLPGLPPQNPGQ